MDILTFTAIGISILALLVSYKAYIKIGSIKRIDLRIELKKDLYTLHRLYSDLTELKDTANKSRLQTLSARGRSSSGDQKIWTSKHTKNEKLIISFERYVNISNTLINGYSDEQLENEIVDIHNVVNEINAFIAFYESSIIEDKEHSKIIMEFAQQRHNRDDFRASGLKS